MIFGDQCSENLENFSSRLIGLRSMGSSVGVARSVRCSPDSSPSTDARRRSDLRRVLLGVLADTPGEELDGHAAERGMATLARPLGVGQRLEQPRELIV